MPSGSLANQIGMRLHVAPGEEVIADSLAHVLRAEMGAAAVFSGITSRSWAAPRGLLDPAAAARADAARRRRLPGVDPAGRGGEHAQLRRRHDPAAGRRSASCARRPASRGVAMHLDGARLWNAHVATGTALAAYGAGVRHRLGVPEQGPRRPGRLGARRQRAGHGRAPGSGASATAAACARPASWPPVGCGRWSTTSTAWPTTTPGPGPWPQAVAKVAPEVVDPDRVETNIVILDVGAAGWTRGAVRRRGRRARGCGCTPRTPGRCGWSWHLDVDDADTAYAADVVSAMIADEALDRDVAGLGEHVRCRRVSGAQSRCVPVHYGRVPQVDLATWSLTIDGDTLTGEADHRCRGRSSPPCRGWRSAPTTTASPATRPRT